MNMTSSWNDKPRIAPLLTAAILLGALLGPGISAAQIVGECRTDAQCSDNVFCNGAEQCMPGAPGADEHGCLTPRSPPCMAGQTCREDLQRCVTYREDRDGDGHSSLATGGDDCDETDANNFPGNAEFWDSADHDEDCNPRTHGLPPGFGTSGRAGPVQVCSGEQYVVLTGSVGGEESFVVGECNYGRVCVPQPSGDGLCESRPDGYVAPAMLANIPAGDQRHADQSQAAAASNAMLAPSKFSKSIAPPTFSAPAKPALPAGLVMPPISACPPGLVHDAKSGTCVKLACPPGTYFDDSKGDCVVK